MSESELIPDEIATLIDYARRQYAEERWPLSPELCPVREIVEKAEGDTARATDGYPAA